MGTYETNRPYSWALLRAVVVGACILALGSGCGSPSQSSQADLEARRADVRYRPQAGAEELMKEGITRKANKGDAVNVDKQGEAALHFADGLDVRIFHDSRITLTSEVNPNAAPIYRYRLEAGTTFNTLSAQAAAAGRVVVVETQWAVITDTGTAFLVYVDPLQATTWTVVTSGTVTMSAAGVAVTVPAGSQSVVEPGKPPEPPTPATRAAVGGRFPMVDALTNNALQEAQVLTSPAAAGAATVLPAATVAAPPPATAPAVATETPSEPPTATPTKQPTATMLPAATEAPAATAASAAVPANAQGAQCDLTAIPDPTQAEVMLRFINTSGSTAVVVWRDTSTSPAQLNEYFQLEDGQMADQETYIGHDWLIQNLSGETLREFTASAEKKQCVMIEQASTEGSATTTVAPIAPTAPAVSGKETEITGEGRVSASSIYSADFQAALAVDGDRSTSWFSAGPNPNGSPTTFQWTGARDDTIVSVFVHGNGDHSNRNFRPNFGFGSVTVQVLDAAGKVVFEQAVALPGTPDPDVQVQPNVVGRSILLLFDGSEAPDCGGFSELQVTALR